MKILWFVDIVFDTAHDQTTWIEMVTQLQKNNQVTMVTRYQSAKVQPKEMKTPIQYIESSQIPFVNRFITYQKQVRNLEGYIQKFNPDVLLFNTHNYFLLSQAQKLRKTYDYRTLLDIRTLPVPASKVRGTIEYHFFKQSLKIASQKFNGLTYITEEMRRFCKEKFKLSKHKSGIWTCGVNTRHFTPPQKRAENKTFTLIYHGNMVIHRGLDNLIKAMALLKSYDIKLVLLGSGRGLKALKKLASQQGVYPKVLFHPRVPYSRVPEYIQKADAGVLPFPDWPGWNTSSPIKMFEYLACGKPVIATMIPAHQNVLEGKEFVFWAPKSSPKKIADAVITAYKKRSDLENLSKKSREFVTHHYTWEKKAKQLEDFLKELI
ncbi:MAG: glycosyltransferase [Candidatus Aminicenantes bacterium]|nr:glycosyltransferase [Candidatus Aminicenantes bacterium]